MPSSGMNVRVLAADRIAHLKDAFDTFGPKAFGRAVQAGLNGAAVIARDNIRDDVLPLFLRNVSRFTREGIRYDVDNRRFDTAESIDDATSAVFITPLQLAYMKFSLGERTRLPGDVGIEGYFQDQSQILIPHEHGLGEFGIRPNSKGQFAGRDIKRIANAMTSSYSASGGARFAGLFEIKAGRPDPARLGIHARPMRGVAQVVRERVRNKVRFKGAAAPTTTFTDRRGRSRTVPKVVNLGTPQLLFLTRPETHYQPNLDAPWQDAMDDALRKVPEQLEEELVEKLDHAIRMGRR